MNTQISFGIFVLLIPVLLAESTKKQKVSKMEVNSGNASEILFLYFSIRRKSRRQKDRPWQGERVKISLSTFKDLRDKLFLRVSHKSKKNSI